LPGLRPELAGLAVLDEILNLREPRPLACPARPPLRLRPLFLRASAALEYLGLHLTIDGFDHPGDLHRL
jgi:hypothetical protein